MQKLKKSGPSKRIESLLSASRMRANRLTDRLGFLPLSLMTIVSLAGFLLVLSMLSGCQPRTVRPSLPQQADPRPLPEFKGKTYRDALMYIPELRESFMACEADKEVIRKAMSDE